MSGSSDEINPFASPLTDSRPLAADIGDTDAEMVRREYLNHEASIQGFGSLFVLGGILAALVATVNLVMAVSIALSNNPGEMESSAMATGGVIALFAGLFTVLYFWVGLGLRALKPQARTPAMLLLAIGLLGFPIGTLINGYGLYLVMSKKGEFVLSKEYAEIRRQTPHIRYKTSVVVWILVAFLVLVMFLALMGALFSLVGG